MIFRNKSRIDFTVNSSLYLRGRYRDVEVIYVGKRNLDPTMLFHKVQKFTPEQFEKMLKEIKENKTNIIIKNNLELNMNTFMTAGSWYPFS